MVAWQHGNQTFGEVSQPGYHFYTNRSVATATKPNGLSLRIMNSCLSHNTESEIRFILMWKILDQTSFIKIIILIASLSLNGLFDCFRSLFDYLIVLLIVLVVCRQQINVEIWAVTSNKIHNRVSLMSWCQAVCPCVILRANICMIWWQIISVIDIFCRSRSGKHVIREYLRGYF